ncbi:MAG: hypothetical protein ABIH42_07340 [Planctomycetota bacterium]
MILAMPEKVEQYLGLKELKSHVYRNFLAHEVLKPEEYNILKQKAQESENKENSGTKQVEKISQEEFLLQMQKAMKRYANVIIVGNEVPKSAIEEISLNPNQVAGINNALKTEVERFRQAIINFYNENCELSPSDNLGSLTTTAILTKMLPKMLPDFQELAKLSYEEQIKIFRGETSVLDYIPRDSFTMCLAYELYKERENTYKEILLFLNDEKKNKFTEKYLMQNVFIFPDNFNLNFGNVNWEKTEGTE